MGLSRLRLTLNLLLEIPEDGKELPLMKMQPSPPGLTQQVDARKVLVLAPHFDDEVLGCGGLICDLTAQGAEVWVLFLSDSAGGVEQVDDPETYAARRLDEAKLSVQEIRAQMSDPLQLPDGKLLEHRAKLAEGILGELTRVKPDLLLVTSPTEITCDHVAAFLAVHDVLSGVRPGDELEASVHGLKILTYEVNHLQHPDLLVNVSAHLETLERAMAHHRSQQERHDYWGAYLGRSKFRALTLGPEVQAVEAYRILETQDFVRRGAVTLVEDLGGLWTPDRLEEGPLISVVVRTHNRPRHLAEALESIAGSVYRRIEVVLVNDGGEVPALPPEYPFEICLVDLQPNRGRAGAADAGVDAAKGAYVAFLDDDDLVDPEHYAVLVQGIRAAGVRVAYSDAAVGVYHLDGEQGWKRTELRLPYSRDFDPDLLLVDNYIPFHTLLVEKDLFDQVGGFRDYPFFEDWDLLIRLARVTPFHHLRRVTCEYRQFRGGGHHILGDRPRERGDFLAMKARIIESHRDDWSAETVARVIDGLRSEAVMAEEARRAEEERRSALEEQFHRLRGTLQAAEENGRRLQASKDELKQDLEAQRRQVTELHVFQEEQSRSLRDAYSEIERLNELIRNMENTRAWKLHQRIQGLKG